MKNIVIDSTEGGAKIKGCVQIPLIDAINKYCKKPIDKSKMVKLRTLADDGDELISRVIPLLQDDIDNLDTIIKESRLGLAVNIGLKNLITRWKPRLTKRDENKFNKLSKDAKEESQAENRDFLHANDLFYNKLLTWTKSKGKTQLRSLIFLSRRNFKHSEIAHKCSALNPLVNVAIYGASRRIQGRALKVNDSLTNFINNHEDAFTRMERNSLILTTAKDAATSLKKSYKETLKLLREYDDTKDPDILNPRKVEDINLDDADDYFEQGNWAHPLLDANKVIGDRFLPLNKAKKIRDKALKLRNKAIIDAVKRELEHLNEERKILKYNDLLEQSRDIGRKDKDFEKALRLIRRAVRLLPQKEEGRWGLATALHHSGKLEESIKVYTSLTADFPEKYRYSFELGQVKLLNGDAEGMKIIGEVMKKTEEFDSFLIRVGEIYEQGDLMNEASIAYEEYLKKYPHDYIGWRKYARCLTSMGKGKEASAALRKATDIKPL